MDREVTRPRITFGIIVLNGEPFVHYNLSALYPFAHEIIVVEGASPEAAHAASPDGHSTDRTLEILHRFKAQEDPKHKITLITAENEGHLDGFWPGEKDQQSQAYARRATGDWLWQVDIDEFYHAQDMRRVMDHLQSHPETTCLTFQAYHFWGGFDYLIDGGLHRSIRFQGEPWGAYRRVFKWKPGYTYVGHRPPRIADANGNEVTHQHKCNIARLWRYDPPMMYHYSGVFPFQLRFKGQYYANQGWAHARDLVNKFESVLKQVDRSNGLRVVDHFGSYNWLQRFERKHPAVIDQLRHDIQNGIVPVESRRTDDIEQLLADDWYRSRVAVLNKTENLRAWWHIAERSGLCRKLRKAMGYWVSLPRRFAGHLYRRMRRTS